MKTTLKKLTLLQEIDARVYALRIRQTEIPRQIEEQVKAVERAQARERDVDARLMELRKTINSKNLKLRECEEKIYQKEVQLNTISTNAAYKAMVKEISGLKADKSLVEDAILELSYSQDELGEEIDDAKREVTSTRNEQEHRKVELGEQSAILDQEIKALMEKRERFLEGIDHTVLIQYEKVLKRRNGQALAPVRDQHCQGCQMNLTLQEMTVLLSCKEILTCRTCSKILYLEEIVEPVEIEP